MQENDIKETLKEIKKKAQENVGWDNFNVLSIDKYEEEAVLQTTLGPMKMSMEDLFEQYRFRKRVFITFSLNLEKVKEPVYSSWLSAWTQNVNDMGMQYGTSMERLKEALELYLESAEEKDVEYLRKGTPVVLPDGEIAFKSLEFTLWTKKNYGMAHTENQVRAKLKELGCKPRQIGPSRMRAWTWVPEVVEQDEEGQVEIKFEGVGRAPEKMNDESLGDGYDHEF